MRAGALVMVLVVAGCNGPAAVPEPIPTPPEPTPVAEAGTELPLAPDFSLVDLEDSSRRHTLDAFAGRYVLVDFWASWCAPCIAEVPNLAAVQEAFADDGFEILSVSLDLDPARVAGFRDRVHPMPWAHALADGGFDDPAAVAYGVDKLPQAFLIGPEGRIVAVTRRLREGRLWATLNETLGTDHWPDE